MDEAPEREASAKLAQHLAVAVQVAEAVIRLRQQAIERRTVATEQAAAAARAETVAQHAADRMVYNRALDADWTQKADLHDLGRAWGAAAGWSDADPVAHMAATRVETRLSDMAPAAMARFDELRQTGTDRIQAMRDVLPSVAAESAARSAGRRVFVADGGTGAQSDSQRTSQAHADDFASVAGDDSSAAARTGDPPAGAAATAGARERRTTPAGYSHPADSAADSFPRPYTEVVPATAATSSSRSPAQHRGKTRALTR